MVLDESAQSVETVELLAPVTVLGEVGSDLSQHFLGIAAGRQFLLGDVLGGFVVELVVFFLLRWGCTEVDFLIEKGSLLDF